jgi:muramoyltetrapeptide carboxypeptidase LdcA involved in peptidoglycan recycling
MEATEGFNFTILYNVDFGHDVPTLVLPIGAKTRIDCPSVGRIGKLSLVEKYLE